MTKLLDLTAGGIALALNSDGTVTDATNATTGAWTTQSAGRVNGIVYTPTGGAPQTIAAQYGLNANNQLTVAIPAQAGIAATAAVPIEGYIAIPDQRNFTYCAIENDDPTDPSFTFHLYGSIAIDPGANTLTLTLAGGPGASLVVQGAVYEGNTALSVAQGDGGLDLIEFSAVTHNPLAGGESIDIPAQISISGLWDIHEGQIKFAANYDSTGQTPTFAIVIAGQLKGVAAGFEFYSTGGSPRLLFTLQGEIRGTNNTGQWNLSIGYAGNKLTATGNIQDTIVTPGGSLTLAGSFSISKGGGAPLTFSVNLNATWKLQQGQLTVAVKGSARNYTLALSGNLVIASDWKVSFQITKGSGGATAFTIGIDYAPPGSALNAQLKIYFDGNKVKLSANISVSLTYVNGMLLPTPPKAPAAPLPPPAPAGH